MATPKSAGVHLAPTSVAPAADVEFAVAQDATDLLPGNPRAVIAVADALGHSADGLTDTTTTLSRSVDAVYWSGTAAATFHAHTRAALSALGEWTDAHDAVSQALVEHEEALAAAQDKATHALSVWRTAQQQAAHAARWDNPGNAAAANAVLLQTQVRQRLALAQQHARDLLDEARSELAEAGDRAATVVRAAHRTVLDAPLPTTGQDKNPATGPTVTVQAPQHGVHDSLSRIAQRTLGDANRWPEIWRLNAGHQVGPHAVLHNPNLIQPGWTLRLPTNAAPVAAPSTPGPLITPPPPVLAPPHIAAPAHGHVVPLPPSVPTPAPPSMVGGPVGGTHLGQDLLIAGGAVAVVGTGVAVAVGAARHRGATTRRSSDQEPVVRAITAAPVGMLSPSAEPGTLDPAGQPEATAVNELTTLLDVASSVGLGVTGPGAVDALCVVLREVLAADEASRAVLAVPEVSLLAEQAGRPAGPFVVPHSTNEPSRIRVEQDHEALLQHLETELLSRTRLLEESGGRDTPPVLAAALSVPHDRGRLQGVADLGAGLRVVVIVLGSWPAGVTCHVTADGQVDAVDGPDWASALVGLPVFTARSTAARDVLALLPQQSGRPVAGPGTDIEPASRPTPPPRADDSYVRGDIQARLASTPVDPVPITASTDQHKRDSTVRSTHPIALTVLGEVAVKHHTDSSSAVDLTATLTPKQCDVLVYLALHPDGVRRETLVAALWPDAPVDRPYNSLHTALSQIRRAIRKTTNDQVRTLVQQRSGRYVLAREVLDVDLWRLNDALRAARQTSHDNDRVAAEHDVTNLYAGHLTAGTDPDWIDGPRESLRREALEAFASLIRTVREHDPQQALHLLERARLLDPYNDAIYRDIMRIQGRLKHRDAIPRTLSLLERALANIDTPVSDETRALASEIQTELDRE